MNFLRWLNNRPKVKSKLSKLREHDRKRKSLSRELISAKKAEAKKFKSATKKRTKKR